MRWRRTIPRAVAVHARTRCGCGGGDRAALPERRRRARARWRHERRRRTRTRRARARIRAGGTQPRVLQAGPAERDEAVVFVHGNPGSCRRLGAARRARSGRAACARSRSTCPTSARRSRRAGFTHDVPSYAAFVDAALERARGRARPPRAARLRRADRAGVGGAARRTRWRASTLIDTGILPGYRWHRLARHLAHAGARRAVPGDCDAHRVPLARRTASEPRGLPRPFLDRMYDHYDRRTKRAVLELYRATDDPGAARPSWSRRHGSKRRLPALVIWGEHDAYLPSSYAARQRDAFPVGRRARAARERPLALRRRAGDGRAAAARAPRGRDRSDDATSRLGRARPPINAEDAAAGRRPRPVARASTRRASDRSRAGRRRSSRSR